MKPSRRGWRRSLSAGTCSPGTASSCAKRTSRNNPNARSAGVSVKNRMSSSRVISGKPRAEPAPPSRTPASAPQHPRTTDMTRHNSLYPLIFRHLDPVPQYGQNVAEVDLTARRRLPHHHSSEAYTSKISSGLRAPLKEAAGNRNPRYIAWPAHRSRSALDFKTAPNAENDQYRDQQQQPRWRLLTPFLPTPLQRRSYRRWAGPSRGRRAAACARGAEGLGRGFGPVETLAPHLPEAGDRVAGRAPRRVVTDRRI
jgi:hypothetical protein